MSLCFMQLPAQYLIVTQVSFRCTSCYTAGTPSASNIYRNADLLKPALSGLDLLVQAKTGTGKTLAFLLPAIERLAQMSLADRKISMLVLSPTRELALQVNFLISS